MATKLLYIISPCVIAAVLALTGIFQSYFGMDESGGWSYLGVIALRPVLICMIITAVLTRFIFKERIFYLWLTELVSVVIVFLIFVKPFIG